MIATLPEPNQREHPAAQYGSDLGAAGLGGEARMGFAGDGQSVYPIVNSDLSDVVGAPGLPAVDVLARTMSKRNHSWKSEAGPDALFLATRTAGVGAFEPFEENLNQEVGMSGCRRHLS